MGENRRHPRPPWEQLPDHNWDRKAVRLLWLGYPDKDIAARVQVSNKTLRNRLYRLRQDFGEDVVPTRQRVKQDMSKKGQEEDI